MIHFVVAMGRPGSCAHLGDRLANAVRETALLGGDLVDLSSPSGTWRLVAVADPDPFLPTRWHVEGEHAVVTNGCAVELGGPVSLPRTLSRARRGGIAAVTDALLGTYNLLCISPEHGLAMSGDVAGLFPLYHGTSPDVVVVSNRSTTVAHALGRTGWNLDALAWLVSMSLLAGEEVPAEGVQVLPAGRVGRVRWGDTRMTIDPGPHPALAAAGTGPGRPDLTAAEWDEVTDALVAEAQALRHIDTPLALPITGGKDSRLLLAVASAAGLTDLLTYTTGPPGDAEVACAAAVAAAAGVVHGNDVPDEVRRPPSRSAVVGPGPVAPLDSRPWHRVARGLGRYEGIVSAWANYKTPIAPASLILKGWGGENYRYRGRMVPCADRFYDSQVPVTDGAEVLASFYAERIDPLRLLVPDRRARQVEWFHQRVHTAVDGLRLDLVPDDVWLAHRSNQFQGPILQSTPMRLIANPLVSTPALRRHSELSLAARRTDRLHYEVMRRAAPELVAIPFFHQTWSEEIRSTAPELDGHHRAGDLGRRAAHAVTHAQSLGRSSLLRQRLEAAARRAERHARVDLFGGTRVSEAIPSGNEPVWQIMVGDRAPVADLLREAADAGLSSICDVDRACGFVERTPRFTRREELQLTDVIGVAMLLLGRTERVVDTRDLGSGG